MSCHGEEKPLIKSGSSVEDGESLCAHWQSLHISILGDEEETHKFTHTVAAECLQLLSFWPLFSHVILSGYKSM